MSQRPEARLTVIGSGTLFPSADRSSASLHLCVDPAACEVGGSASGERRSDALRSGEHGSDRVDSLLLDCGWGTLHALARLGIDWPAIDAVAISHYHGDHIGDLPALLAAWRQADRRRPLTLFGPSDLGRQLAALEGAFGAWLTKPGFPMRVVELGHAGSWADEGGRLNLSSHDTPHTRESIAFRLEGAWGSMGYTGDTAPATELADFFRGVDVLVAECALPDPPPFAGHLTPASLSELVDEARPGLLMTTHAYPPLDPEDVADQLRERYEGRVVAASDGKTVSWVGGDVTVDRPAGHD